jgi:hypothetical protein
MNAPAGLLNDPANANEAQVQELRYGHLLPNPADTLAKAQQRFPNASPAVLRGELAHNDTSDKFTTLATQIRANPPQPGVIPISIGEGSQATVALMPTRGVKGPDVAQKIQNYVTEGKQLFDTIMEGGHPERADKKEVAKLMWYLQALGSAKAAQSSGGNAPALYREGAMFVEDPQGLLQSFLEKANSYGRSSSHMKDYQHLGDAFKSRGVDIRNVETPNSRKTVLFARLPRDSEAPAGGPQGTGDTRMLFVKMEPNGCRGISFKGSGTVHHDSSASAAWKGFKRFFGNAKDIFQHAMNFTTSLRQRAGLLAIEGQNNRERIPTDVKEFYQGVQGWIRNSTADEYMTLCQKPITEDQAQAMLNRAIQTMEQGSPFSDAGGIKQMVANMEAVISQLEDLPTFSAWLAKQVDTLKAHGDHPEMRIGNEVILTREEMGGLGTLSTITPYSGQGVLKAEGTLSNEAQELMLAGLQYRLDNIDSAHKVDTFIVDALRTTYKIGRHSFAPGEKIPQNFQEGSLGATFHHSSDLAAMDAVIQLADKNSRVATALMSLANQSIPGEITAKAQGEALAFSGILLPQPGMTEFNIALHGHNDKGETVYSIKAIAEERPDHITRLNANFAADITPCLLDSGKSLVRCEMEVLLTVHDNGSMTPAFASTPGYSYTLTPQSAAPAASVAE